ncbi:MAG: histidine phosphatase family protein [Fimbriiglobus sp.]|nr:histidine phosphatase family protein [Fimbriiglobus sp.]
MSLPERVWLLRHAETTAPHVFNGAESDVDLSDLGRQQAAAVAGWFAPLRPTAVASSAMIRAINTAAPIAAACGVPRSVFPRLHERRIGPLAGQPFDTQIGPWHDTTAAWTAGNTAFTTEGAESFDDLANRLVPAWNEVVRAHPGGRLVVVAHGIVIKVLLLCILEGYDVRQWTAIGKSANVSVSELVPAVGGKWRAESLLVLPEPVAAVNAAAVPNGLVSSA